MDVSEIDLDLNRTGPPRKKRRPALACEQCRRKKIKCDRQSPCRPCTKTNEACDYVSENRQLSNTAPFEASETRFSVFEQDPQRQMVSATTISDAPPIPASASIVPLDGAYNGSDSANLASFSDQLMVPIGLELAPMVEQLEIDERLSSLFESSTEFATPNVEAHAVPNLSSCGAFFKTRFYGLSHWMNFAYQTPEVLSAIRAFDVDGSRHGYVTFARCKEVGKSIKSQRSIIVEPPPNALHEMIPSRPVATRLVQAYLRTFQTILGILYVPCFSDNYNAFWENGKSSSDTFCITLLLVMSIGSIFCPYETGISRETALQWLSEASMWSNSPKRKKRLNIDGLRIHCLLLLARQVRSIDADTAWVSTGTLLRMAMHIGLHIDPKHLPSFHSMSMHEAESRRRLWATVLELEVQSSMDGGCLPSLSQEENDCSPPLNIDDAALVGKNASESIVSKPLNQFTQSSIQILLMKSINIRLKIASFINSLRRQDSFKEANALSAELSAALTNCSAAIETYCMSSAPPTPFQRGTLHLFLHRFLLSLHHPFAIKSFSDPAFRCSSKICRDTSLSFFSNLTQSGDDDFYRLRLSGSGLFRNVYTQASLYMCSELTNGFAMKEMRQAVEQYIELAAARIRAGETNVRCYVLMSCLLSLSEARRTGTPTGPSVFYKLKESLEAGYSLLKAQLNGQGSANSEPSEAASGFAVVEEDLGWSQWNDTSA
ncbi:MAG: hypothetical protein M1822_002587 [Bathelium mastoideum]|nr:MAG: hypothetical protein M1822_002587 [Bathelium mastoideum]